MRKRLELKKELTDMLNRYGLDSYCSEPSTVLAENILKLLQETAILNTHR